MVHKISSLFQRSKEPSDLEPFHKSQLFDNPQANLEDNTLSRPKRHLHPNEPYSQQPQILACSLLWVITFRTEKGGRAKSFLHKKGHWGCCVSSSPPPNMCGTCKLRGFISIKKMSVDQQETFPFRKNGFRIYVVTQLCKLKPRSNTLEKARVGTCTSSRCENLLSLIHVGLEKQLFWWIVDNYAPCFVL